MLLGGGVKKQGEALLQQSSFLKKQKHLLKHPVTDLAINLEHKNAAAGRQDTPEDKS